MPKSYFFLMIFFFYSMILLYFGKSGYKEIETIDDFFSGGRKMGLFACISTFVATWFSAASMQGLSGALFMYGYASVLYSVVPWFIGAYLLMRITPRLRASGAMTIPEYFYIRYNSRMLQLTGGLIVIVNFILYIVIQIRGFGLVVSEFLDISYTMSILLIYVFVLYTTFGGLFSISKSDGFNSIIIVTGVLVAAGYILSRAGGVSDIHRMAAAVEGFGIEGSPYFTQKGTLLSPTAGGSMPVLSLISAFFGWGLGLASNPQYTVRIIAAKDDRTAKAMIKKSMGILAVIYGCLVIIGLGSRVIAGPLSDIESIDQIFPYIFHAKFPIHVGGIVLIALMAAAISTANSQLLVVSSSFVYDIFAILSKRDYRDETLIFISRIVIFAAGSISLLLAISPPASLLIYGSYVWGVFSVAFLIPLYGGMFIESASSKSAVVSMCAGLFVMGLFILLTPETQAVFSINPAMYGVLVALFVFVGLNLKSEKRRV